MATWTLVPCLVTLRNEFNTLAPARDKSSDGSIGDQAHASSSSDHNPDETGSTPYEDADNINEVHAIDVDVELRLAGWSMAKAVEIIVRRHRLGLDDRLQNVIYKGRIWSRSWGWTAREYTGPNPHDKHAHFSSRYTTAQEQNTKPWGLLEEARKDDDMPLSGAADKKFIQDSIRELLVDDDDPVAGRLKARAVQYVGGGLPGNLGEKASLLTYFTDQYRKIAETQILITKGFTDSAARDAQDAARDAGVLALLQAVQSTVAAGQKGLTPAQFDELKTLIGQKMVEAGQDAADAANAKIGEIAEALEAAGQAMADAIKENPPA